MELSASQRSLYRTYEIGLEFSLEFICADEHIGGTDQTIRAAGTTGATRKDPKRSCKTNNKAMLTFVHAAGIHVARAVARGRTLLSRLRDTMAETRRQREVSKPICSAAAITSHRRTTTISPIVR